MQEMTTQKAIAVIRDHSYSRAEEGDEELCEALDMAAAALEKQIPKRVRGKRIDEDGRLVAACPTCFNFVSGRLSPHICRCGQRLNWSKTEEKTLPEAWKQQTMSHFVRRE